MTAWEGPLLVRKSRRRWRRWRHEIIAPSSGLDPSSKNHGKHRVSRLYKLCYSRRTHSGMFFEDHQRVQSNTAEAERPNLAFVDELYQGFRKLQVRPIYTRRK